MGSEKGCALYMQPVTLVFYIFIVDVRLINIFAYWTMDRYVAWVRNEDDTCSARANVKCQCHLLSLFVLRLVNQVAITA